jgi:DNA-binding response OmpR family regulator
MSPSIYGSLSILRKKIEPNPAKPKYILTEPWVGYRFVALADVSEQQS